MNDRQENIQSMHNAVIKFMDESTAVWNGLQALVSKYDEFKDKAAAIEAMKSAQIQDITGIAEDKQKKRDLMISKAVSISSILSAYAINSGNAELKNAIGFTESDFLRARHQDVLTMSRLVHDKAAENLGNLGEYAITAEILAEFQAVINGYAEVVQRPRTAIAIRAATTKALQEMFDESSEILEVIDNLVTTFRDSQPLFVSEYFLTRQIIDRGPRATGTDGAVSSPTQ